MKGNLLTVAEAAEELGVAAETVRRYIREKKLRAEKKKVRGLQKVWVISQEEIQRFQNAQ